MAFILSATWRGRWRTNMSTTSEECESFFRGNDRPACYDDYQQQIKKFCETQAAENNKVVLITSGGTSIPLEHNTVRFVDNFSLGTRGAASAEYFLEHEYAVIFLYRHRSFAPFSRHLPENPFELFQLCPDDDRSLEVVPEKAEQLVEILKKYELVRSSGRLLTLPFTTLVEYLWFLRGSAEVLASLRHNALMYLAAAVSDFYVPQKDMTTHKIHSDAAFTLTLHLAPKILRPLVRQWAPLAYVVSFKLETDESVMIEKARRALDNYGHQVVVANLLKSRRSVVTFVSATSEETVSLSNDDLNEGTEIEQHIVNRLVERHKHFIKN